MKSTAHPAAILPTTGYTEHVDAKIHPALLALHATSPTLFPTILWGLLFFFPHPLLLLVSPLLHSSPSCFCLSLYLCFSCSLRIAGLLRRAAEPWDRPWLKLPVNDKGPNAAAHALILICMHPQQHIFPPCAHFSDTTQTETQRQPFWNSCMELRVMEELCPGHQRGQNRCNKSTRTRCDHIMLFSALQVHDCQTWEKTEGARYRKVHVVTLQLLAENKTTFQLW